MKVLLRYAAVLTLSVCLFAQDAPKPAAPSASGQSGTQLFVDFTLQSGRGEEQAEFLIEHALGFRE